MKMNGKIRKKYFIFLIYKNIKQKHLLNEKF